MNRTIVIMRGDRIIYRGPPVNQDFRIVVRNDTQLRCYRVILENDRCRFEKDFEGTSREDGNP